MLRLSSISIILDSSCTDADTFLMFSAMRFHCIAFDWSGLAMHCQDGRGWLIGTFAVGTKVSRIAPGTFSPSHSTHLTPALTWWPAIGEWNASIHGSTLKRQHWSLLNLLFRQKCTFSDRRWLQSIAAQNLFSYKIHIDNCMSAFVDEAFLWQK